jgi:hypothetical protein
MKRCMPAFLFLCIQTVPVFAHHSFPATYLVNEETEVTGEVVAFLYRNPHATIQVMVAQPDGEKVRYLIEWAGAANLANTGVNRGTLISGDTLVIRGNPGRNESDHRMRLLSVTRPSDGWTWGEDYE